MIITLRTATTDFLARLDNARLGRQRQIARCCAIVGRRRQSFGRIRSFLADLNDNDDKGVLAHGGFGSSAKVDGGLSA
jgi:hypothetical protein